MVNRRVTNFYYDDLIRQHASPVVSKTTLGQAFFAAAASRAARISAVLMMRSAFSAMG